MSLSFLYILFAYLQNDHLFRKSSLFKLGSAAEDPGWEVQGFDFTMFSRLSHFYSKTVLWFVIIINYFVNWQGIVEVSGCGRKQEGRQKKRALKEPFAAVQRLSELLWFSEEHNGV